MQLKITTDYAIRMVLYMSIVKKRVSSKELSENLNIAQSIVFKIGKSLSNHGILQIKSGVNGGFLLLKKPKDISIYDVINIFEPTIKINRCLEEDAYCSRFATESCPVRKFYSKLQSDIEVSLKEMTIERLLL